MFDMSDKEALKSRIKGTTTYPVLNQQYHGCYARTDIEIAIRMSMESMIDAIVDEIYTAQDFERDLGLDK